MSWRERFGMHATPLPRGAVGESFFSKDPHYQRLAQAFAWLASEPGIGVLTGEPGVGKTSAIRHLCRALPASEHRVVYLCDCAVKPLDLYRMLAAELGLRPGPRAQIVADIKRALVSLVDERGVVPIVILDDAQGLRDDLLHELHGLCSLDFDGRDYLTLWLVGHPLLARRLRLQQHAALAQRVIVYAPLVAAAHQPPPPARPRPRRRAGAAEDRRVDHELGDHPAAPRAPQPAPAPASKTPLRARPEITEIARPDTLLCAHVLAKLVAPRRAHALDDEGARPAAVCDPRSTADRRAPVPAARAARAGPAGRQHGGRCGSTRRCIEWLAAITYAHAQVS
ncbi:MAG: ATP-binding protein [Nannocystis sp.]|nr:ATP-binding protein [Nannocystis sp.]